MGFLDAASGYLKEKNERLEHYKLRYGGKSDEELKKLFSQSTGDKKIAIGMLLKERGY